ncbi:hypothetical protein [Vibrio parahaemolyticus]
MFNRIKEKFKARTLEQDLKRIRLEEAQRRKREEFEQREYAQVEENISTLQEEVKAVREHFFKKGSELCTFLTLSFGSFLASLYVFAYAYLSFENPFEMLNLIFYSSVLIFSLLFVLWQNQLFEEKLQHIAKAVVLSVSVALWYAVYFFITENIQIVHFLLCLIPFLTVKFMMNKHIKTYANQEDKFRKRAIYLGKVRKNNLEDLVQEEYKKESSK